MKKLLVLGAMAIAALSISAQDYQGKWFIGGNYGFTSSKTKDKGVDDLKPSNFVVAPLIGTFIQPTLAVGAELGFASSKEGGVNSLIEGHRKGNTDYKTNMFQIAPLVRKYFPLGDSGFNFFGQLALPVGFGDSKATKNAAEKTKYFNIGLKLDAGFDYFINETFSFETSLNVANLAFQNEKFGDKKTDSFGLNANPFQDLGVFKVGFKVLF